MSNIFRMAGNFLVIMLVAFPPFLYFYRYINRKFNNIFIKLIISGCYWGGTLLLSNTVPAVVVLYLIISSKRGQGRLQSGAEIKEFSLDCTGPKWKFSFIEFTKIFLWGIVIKAAVTSINILVISILSKFDLSLKNQEIVNEFLKSNAIHTILYFAMIVIFAPIVEEFVFRFWIYDRLLKKRIGTGFAVLLSSMLFMTAHFNVQGAAAFFLIGAINCYLYEKIGYWAAVTNHFVFNLISAVMLVAVKALNLSF